MKRSAAAGWLLPAALFLFSLLLYANSLSNGFALDDTVAIERNPLLRDLANVPELFASDYWAPYFDAGLYRPLVTTSYALNHAAGGLDPFGFHGVNVLLHAAITVLVLLLYRALTNDDLAASLAAFLFAAHAVHTEAVANVVGRAELLSAAFLLGALLAHVRVRSADADATRPAVISAALLLFALLCKESAITLLGVFVLYDFSFARGEGGWSSQRLRELRRPYALYLGVAACYLLVRVLVVQAGPATGISPLDNPLVTLDAPWKTLNALMVGLRYVGLLFAPLELRHDYSLGAIELIRSGDDLRWIGAILGSVAVASSLVLAYRVSRPIFFALGFGFVTFSVASNLLVTIGTIMGERLVYVPSIGFCLALVLTGRLLLGRLPLSPRSAQTILCVFAVALIAANAWRSVTRNLDWRSDETLNETAITSKRPSAKVHYNTAHMRFEQKRFDEAVHHAQTAVELWPPYGKAWAVLGHALVRAGRADEARPAYEEADRFGVADAGVNNNLGYMLLEQGGQNERAVTMIERAVEIEPDNPAFLDSLGWAYFQTGRGTLERARELIARSLELDDAGPSGETRRSHLLEVETALRTRDTAPN